MSYEERTERRKYLRMPFREDITVEGMGSYTSTEISNGGLFVSSIHNLIEDNTVEISIPFREGKITVKAIVGYCEPGIGAGLIFINLNDEQKTNINELVESLAKS